MKDFTCVLMSISGNMVANLATSLKANPRMGESGCLWSLGGGGGGGRKKGNEGMVRLGWDGDQRRFFSTHVQVEQLACFQSCRPGTL